MSTIDHYVKAQEDEEQQELEFPKPAHVGPDWETYADVGDNADAGKKCPYCGSDDLRKYNFEDFSPSAASLTTRCNACGREWQETFELFSISERNTPGITPAMDNTYVMGSGTRCPFCRSEQINSSGLNDIAGATGTAIVDCDACGADWYDVFMLASAEGEEAEVVEKPREGRRLGMVSLAQEEEQPLLNLGEPPPPPIEDKVWESAIPMGEPMELSPVTVYARHIPGGWEVYRVEDSEGVELDRSIWLDHVLRMAEDVVI